MTDTYLAPHDSATPDDPLWPEIAWTETAWDRILAPDVLARVEAYATAHQLGVADAVAQLTLAALDHLDARAAGGHKRWDGVTAADRRALATRAAQARWGKRDSRPATP